MKTHLPLKPEALYRHCDLSQFEFTDTSELQQLHQPLGQARALEAIEFGVDINRDGFNLFVLGAPGLGKHELVREILTQNASRKAARYDWCYVNNFTDPQRPIALKLPVGMGQKLRKDMHQLVEDLLTGLPSAFQSEEYLNRRQEIDDEFQERQDEAFGKLDKEARELGISLLRTPAGYTLAPVVDKKILGPEEFQKLPKEEQERFEELIARIQKDLQKTILGLPLLKREHHQRVKALHQEITRLTIEQLIAWIEHDYENEPQVREYIASVKSNAIENVQDFLASDGEDTESAASRVDEFQEYSVNIIVDNTDTQGAPVIYEDNPTYQSLIGRIEHVSQMGTLLTDFTLIKSGALLRANGGYLIIDAQKLLVHPYAWEGLKRALKSHEVKIESLESMLNLVSTMSLEPQTIPLDIKIALIGPPYLYYLLKTFDPEFNQLFKVTADFSHDTDRNRENMLGYAQIIATIQQRDALKPLEKPAVGRVIEQAARNAADSEKLSLQLEALSELLHEADYWATRENVPCIRREDVETALEKKRYRHDSIRERLQEQITRGIKRIETSGRKAGQVNGLSVLQLGDISIGQPSRITATARLGSGKVIDIEREVELGGHIHSKGVMILSSYLANRYARERPLPVAATLVFEQSYGRVDGDSASAAELCVLLSAIGNLPLKQSLAVTGSIDQRGEMQAIGGVNEKIEGFFDICLAQGLSGEQGVVIPVSNLPHLMLREEIREAVENHLFGIYTAARIEDVMELLSDMPRSERATGEGFAENSFEAQIERQIENFQKLHDQFASRKGDEGGNSDTPGQ